MPRPKTTGCLRPDDEPLVLRQIGERELVRVQEPSRNCASQAVCVPRVALLCHSQITPERRLDRSQDVSTTAAGAQKKDVHVTPVCFRPRLNLNGTTTHSACV